MSILERDFGDTEAEAPALLEPRWGLHPIDLAWLRAQDGAMDDSTTAELKRARAQLPAALKSAGHPGLRVRLRTRFHAPALDRVLASGGDPLASAELAWRSDQLVHPAKREDLARSLELISEAAGAGWLQLVPGPTIRNRRAVITNTAALLELAARLRARGPHALAGLARTDLLIRSGDSPLYDARSCLQLSQEIDEILDSLDVAVYLTPGSEENR